MISITAFLSAVDAYCLATKIAEATLSTRLFNDGKRLTQIRDGADIGVLRLERAIRWLSGNWPDGTAWPRNIERPIITEAAA